MYNFLVFMPKPIQIGNDEKRNKRKSLGKER